MDVRNQAAAPRVGSVIESPADASPSPRASAVGPAASDRIKLLVAIAVAVLLLIGPAFLSGYWVGLLTQMVILGMLAMSLDLLLGYTGLPSLGHAGIFGVAAYGVAVLSAT